MNFVGIGYDEYNYKKMLLYLIEYSKMFCIVDGNSASEKFDDIYKHIRMGEKLIEDLEEYNYKTEKVKEWAGMSIRPATERQYATRYWYKSGKKELKILSGIFNFLDVFEDIAFYDPNCILYTVSHEDMIFIEKSFFEILTRNDVVYIK